MSTDKFPQDMGHRRPSTTQTVSSILRVKITEDGFAHVTFRYQVADSCKLQPLSIVIH